MAAPSARGTPCSSPNTLPSGRRWPMSRSPHRLAGCCIRQAWPATRPHFPAGTYCSGPSLAPAASLWANVSSLPLMCCARRPSRTGASRVSGDGSMGAAWAHIGPAALSAPWVSSRRTCVACTRVIVRRGDAAGRRWASIVLNARRVTAIPAPVALSRAANPRLRAASRFVVCGGG